MLMAAAYAESDFNQDLSHWHWQQQQGLAHPHDDVTHGSSSQEYRLYHSKDAALQAGAATDSGRHLTESSATA
jgi:hypothetical protein